MEPTDECESGEATGGPVTTTTSGADDVSTETQRAPGPGADEQRTGLSRRALLRRVGGAGAGVAVGVTGLSGVAAAHEVRRIVFCECAEVTVVGDLLLGSDEPSDATGDGGYRAVIYCGEGQYEWIPLRGTQTYQHYSLLDDPAYDAETCQIVAVHGETYHPSHGGTDFTICNQFCEWDCAGEGIAGKGSGWCDDPADVPSGGGQGGVDPDADIVVDCVTDCLEPVGREGCTPGYWKEPAYRNGVWTNEDTYGPDTRVDDVFQLAVTGETESAGSERATDTPGRSPGSGGPPRRGRPGKSRGPRGKGAGPASSEQESGPPGHRSTRGSGVMDHDWNQMTLHEALDGGGGPGIEGAQRILLRAAVAALLDAQHGDIAYPLGSDEIIDLVNDALASEDREEILALAHRLDSYNNLGCPLDAFGRTG